MTSYLKVKKRNENRPKPTKKIKISQTKKYSKQTSTKICPQNQPNKKNSEKKQHNRSKTKDMKKDKNGEKKLP